MPKYEYYLKDQKLGFDKGIEILKSHYPGRVFAGWPSITYSSEENDRLISDLNNYNIQTAQIEIAPEDFHAYLHDVNYHEKYPHYYPGHFFEKTFEHFLALKILNLQNGERFVDVGAENSPHADIFGKLTGSYGYIQDIMFQPGIHGNKIGCDASIMPVENCFCDAILAACAIEHFENSSDIKSITEASRILKTGGRILILPLYLHEYSFYATDPIFSVPGEVNFSEAIPIHCVQDWGNRHGRFYSPQTLYQRLIEKNINTLDFNVIHVKNFRQIHPSIYCRFCLLGIKK